MERHEFLDSDVVGVSENEAFECKINHSYLSQRLELVIGNWWVSSDVILDRVDDEISPMETDFAGAPVTNRRYVNKSRSRFDWRGIDVSAFLSERIRWKERICFKDFSCSSCYSFQRFQKRNTSCESQSCQANE